MGDSHRFITCWLHYRLTCWLHEISNFLITHGLHYMPYGWDVPLECHIAQIKEATKFTYPMLIWDHHFRRDGWHCWWRRGWQSLNQQGRKGWGWDEHLLHTLPCLQSAVWQINTCKNIQGLLNVDCAQLQIVQKGTKIMLLTHGTHPCCK